PFCYAAVLLRALVLFFFFQAEDGIRDFHVTGVQTCALPIWVRGSRPRRREASAPRMRSRRHEDLPARPLPHARRPRRTGRPRRQIGRASCRERAESSVGAGASKEGTKGTSVAARAASRDASA